MKTIKLNTAFSLSLLSIILLFTGCEKYLDQQPITEIGPKMVFSDVPNTQKALAGVYSRLMGDQGYGIRLSLYYTVDNDETMGPSGNADNDRRDMARYALTPGNAQLNRPFQQLFQGIEYANICIANIPKSDMFSNGTSQQKAQMKRMLGEALTLRAQFYSEAIRIWGDLPAHFNQASEQATSDPFPRQTDRDSLYDVLLNDLAYASELVPWKNELPTIGDQIDERITKGAVKGLRARIALFRGGYSLRNDGVMRRGSNYLNYYQIAKDECNDIIQSGQHNLNPSFRSLWKDQVCGHAVSDPDGELMFQASAYGNAAVQDSKLGYYNGPAMGPYGNKSINVLPTYFYLFDSMDLRRDVTIAPYNVQADGVTKTCVGGTGLNDGKFRRDWITGPSFGPTNAIQYFSLKWQFIRYSDVLLMYAEAENELNGPSSSAYEALNKVRRRGYGVSISAPSTLADIPSGLSKADFFKVIVRERSLELGGEGIRKFDLIRWNLLNAAITENRNNMINMAQSFALTNPSYMAPYPAYSISTTLPTSMYYFTGTRADDVTMWKNSFYYPSGFTTTPAGTTKITWVSTSVNTTLVSRYASGFTTGKSELFPFPQPAVDANFNLKQNPGY
jgi:hypothetical protein